MHVIRKDSREEGIISDYKQFTVKFSQVNQRNICQCHANIAIRVINCLGTYFSAILTHQKILNATTFMVASIIKECEPYSVLEQTGVNCSLMQIGILRKMTHEKDKHKLISWID